jgi:hypothetical protein
MPATDTGEPSKPALTTAISTLFMVVTSSHAPIAAMMHGDGTLRIGKMPHIRGAVLIVAGLAVGARGQPHAHA